MQVFTNNARTVLAVALDAGAYNEEMVAVGDGSAELFASLVFSAETPPEEQSFQMATLVDPSDSSVMEIVRIKGRDGVNFIVDRAQENTDSRAWPAGTIVEARITAGMLKEFAQDPHNRILRSGEDGAISLPRARGFVVNGRIGPSINGAYDAVQIAGFPALQLVTAEPTQHNDVQDANLTHEAVGGTRVVNLGITEVWDASNRRSNSVVVPRTADGFQYTLEIASQVPGLVFSGAVSEPADGASGLSDAFSLLWGGGLGSLVGRWIPTELPVAITSWLGGPQYGGLLVTEVGFICLKHGAGSTPTVSIGVDGSPGLFADSVALSQISGVGHVHRIPVTLGGPIAKNLRFAVNTPSDADFTGRFYWKGVFIDTDIGQY
ncbi:MAG: hypothetical protein LBV05_12840 [Comamonas sp.]|jgi:hypothetical protein|uniref:hypothetical protein n=1 Tax=Comamonas sp. TaxID=34028 RepID=UPI00283D2D37|nr:hypothetical protein [Comamonas sp.]MDR3066373.1 hypothetical protein [Comamonas sp.]